MQVVTYLGGYSALGIIFVLYRSVTKYIQSRYLYLLVSSQLFPVFVMSVGFTNQSVCTSHFPHACCMSVSPPPLSLITIKILGVRV
jgi:hypothetical protein